ncbi:MAG: hypothetical protein JXA96_17980 [Sedimentisphaerales bacterium]|nr:hypothetical protein [Sedimentisphaerales bacterium]
MKNVLIAIFLFTVGCQSMSRIGIQEQTGFKELPFPSNSLSPGQIVEIYLSPEDKVELSYDPNIPKDSIKTSSGWDISIEKKKKLTAGIEIQIKGIFKSTFGTDSDRDVKVSFSDMKTCLIPKSVIYSTLKKKIEENDSGVKDLLSKYIAEGTQFDVITTTLSATVSFKVVDSLKAEANTRTMVFRESDKKEIESETVKNALLADNLNAKFGLSAYYDSKQNKTILGENLVIGIHRDTRMVSILMDD